MGISASVPTVPNLSSGKSKKSFLKKNETFGHITGFLQMFFNEVPRS